MQYCLYSLYRRSKNIFTLFLGLEKTRKDFKRNGINIIAFNQSIKDGNVDYIKSFHQLFDLTELNNKEQIINSLKINKDIKDYLKSVKV